MLPVQSVSAAQATILDLMSSASSQQSLSSAFATKSQLSPKMHELRIKYEAEKACKTSSTENNN
jgi:hypothetical protein